MPPGGRPQCCDATRIPLWTAQSGSCAWSLSPGHDEPESRWRVAPRSSPHPATVGAILNFVRWAVEFVLQVVGWTMLAIGGGSLYLLVTTGSAPAIGFAPAAVAVVLGSAALIWVTRRSLYKKQYRRY